MVSYVDDCGMTRAQLYIFFIDIKNISASLLIKI